MVLITGATGFLGSLIAEKIVNCTDLQVVALIRAKTDSEAIGRLERKWWDRPALMNEIGCRIHVLRGDITQENLGLSSSSYKHLISEIKSTVEEIPPEDQGRAVAFLEKCLSDLRSIS